MSDFERIIGPLHPDPLVVHDEKLAPMFLDRLLARPELKGAFRCPAAVQIVTWSNYPEKTILEKSLDYLGITDYVVLGKDLEKFPLNAKIPLTLDFLLGPRSTAPIVVWMDSRDAVLLGDPARFVALLEEAGCDALFSSTDYFFQGCGDIHAVERKRAEHESTLTPYLNSGVVIGKKEFLIEVLKEAKTHVGKPFSPFDPANDQPIFALMYKNLYPKLKVNTDQRLALRSAFSDIYLYALGTKGTSVRDRREQTWWWQALAAFKQCFVGRKGAHAEFFRYFLLPYDRNRNGWMIGRRLRRIAVLLRIRSGYTDAIRRIRASEWAA